MARVEGLSNLVAKLRSKAASIKDTNVSVAVGYTAAYALFVHENLEMKLKGQPRPLTKKGTSQGSYWDPPGRGRSKFLEHPFRANRKEYLRIALGSLAKGQTMSQALLLAGLRVQRDSQQLVPVNTGNLKASAFTRLEVPAKGKG